ncbi:MAG: hypothetical protein WA749_08615 [Gelidibacter sp.]
MKLIKIFLIIHLMFFAVGLSAQSVHVTNTGEKYHKTFRLPQFINAKGQIHTVRF